MSVPPPVPVVDEDAARLAELGYKQELHRGMSGFSNFAVSFSIISILAGCITSYGIAMNSGGPIAISVGWPLVGAFVLCVALAMGEICSVYPTAGGLYFWAGRLARKNKPVWAWYVGWFNFLGEVAVTAAIDYGAALTWTAFANLAWGWTATPVHTFILFAVILLSHGLLNTFGVNLVALLSNISAWWHLVGVAVIVVVLAFIPDHHQSLSWTFFHYENHYGWANPIYVFFIGLLMAQYTYTGFDASAHISEETHSASTNAPKGIVNSSSRSSRAGSCSLRSPRRSRTTTRSWLRRPGFPLRRSSSTPPGARRGSSSSSSVASHSTSVAWLR
jgi:amino acid transporter